MNKRVLIACCVIFGILIADQLIKIYVKTHFILGEEHSFASWFKIHFTENPGMAFGMEFGGAFGKLALSSFRIGAAIFGVYYIRKIIKEKYHPGYIAAIAFIFAGAVGNIIDSMFYGIFFSESYTELATFMAAQGGYAGFLHGKVVDMFYFPLLEGNFPNWLPIWGGEYFIFFRPVFNLADASITTGVLMILLWQRKFFLNNPTKISSVSPEASLNQEETMSQPSND